MSENVKTNIVTILKQVYNFGPLDRINMLFAANRGGIYNSEEGLFEIQVDEKGRVVKATQTNTLGYTSNGTQITDKVATIFIYNENNDVKQQIYDRGDDGIYEYTYDFNCVYDENNKLISHEETKWSKFRNGFKRFFGLEEHENSYKTPYNQQVRFDKGRCIKM